MTEIRTTSSTGGQKGVKPERHDLIPKLGVDAIARVFAFGAEKYADHNWRRGYEWGKSYSALIRHLTAFWDGETHDPESGLPHLAHAGFHVLVLLTWLEEQGEGVDNEFDDRWPVSMERARLAEQAALEEEQDEMVTVGWREPVTLTLHAAEVSKEAIEAAFGIFRRNAPCTVEPVFDEDDGGTLGYSEAQYEDQEPRGIPTRPWDMTYEEWQAEKARRADQEATDAANIVTGQQGVQRSFDLRD